MEGETPTLAQLTEARRDVKRGHDLALREVEAMERIAEIFERVYWSFEPLITAYAEEFKEEIARKKANARV